MSDEQQISAFDWSSLRLLPLEQRVWEILAGGEAVPGPGGHHGPGGDGTSTRQLLPHRQTGMVGQEKGQGPDEGVPGTRRVYSFHFFSSHRNVALVSLERV